MVHRVRFDVTGAKVKGFSPGIPNVSGPFSQTLTQRSFLKMEHSKPRGFQVRKSAEEKPGASHSLGSKSSWRNRVPERSSL